MRILMWFCGLGGFSLIMVALTASATGQTIDDEKVAPTVDELKVELAACQAELTKLKEPKPLLPDDDYSQSVDALQQRIQQLGEK